MRRSTSDSAASPPPANQLADGLAKREVGRTDATLSGKQRRELIARGHALKASIAIGRPGVTEPLVKQIQQAFTGTELLKVRLDADDRDEADTLAGLLAERVGCTLLQRVGRVALLFHPKEEAAR